MVALFSSYCGGGSSHSRQLAASPLVERRKREGTLGLPSLSNGEDPSEMPQEKKGETGKSKTRKVAEDGIFLFLSANKQKQTGKKREIKVRPSSPSSAPPPSRTPSASEPRRTARNRSWRNSNYAHGKHTCGINCFSSLCQFSVCVHDDRPGVVALGRRRRLLGHGGEEHGLCRGGEGGADRGRRRL